MDRFCESLRLFIYKDTAYVFFKNVREYAFFKDKIFYARTLFSYLEFMWYSSLSHIGLLLSHT